MPRFIQPFAYRIAASQPDGPLRVFVRAEVVVDIRDARGDWISLGCLVDTGASFPTMGTLLARSLGLAVPDLATPLKLRTANGTVEDSVRDGELTVRYPRLPECELPLKWVFRDGRPAGSPPLLGLHNTIDLLSVLFDGTPRPDGVMGSMEFAVRAA